MHLSELNWHHHFANLGDKFFSRVTPSALTQPRWVHINSAVAESLGISADALRNDDCLKVFSGASTIAHNGALAMVYAGHQFGGYSAQLGDGRGVLLGQLQLPSAERHSTKLNLVDIHLKGAGKTPYSRFGDGRAVLRSSIREYLAGEALHGLGIATSRALCITTSDDPVIRETTETAAMVARTAKTHIRFGHFEYFHYQEKFTQVKQLADHIIEQFLPEYISQPDGYQKLLSYCVQNTAQTIAQWQSVGFAHGVMNTDNMSIIGETLDYGPYGFLDDYEPGFICNHSDHQGRYAFDQQPNMGLWNLNALAHALSSLIDHKTLQVTLAEYEPCLINHYASLMRQKLGLEQQRGSDRQLCADILHLMAQDKVDYTLFFRHLSHYSASSKNQAVDDLFIQHDKFKQWQLSYKKRLGEENRSETERQQAMLAVNPKFILRNYLLQNAIDKAQQYQDYSDIDRLLTCVQTPYDEQPHNEELAKAPPTWGKHLPISCSS